MTTTPDQVGYCTREQVQDTLDQGDSVRLNRRIDDAVRAGSSDVEGHCHRRFYPTRAVIYPDPQRHIQGAVLDLDHIDRELLTVDTITSDGVELVEGTDYYLWPDQPPYTEIRLIDTGTATWGVDDRSVVITGDVGGSNNTAPAGALAAAIASGSVTTMTVTNSALVGVGDLVQVDSERVIVTEKEWVTSGATVTGTVDDSDAVTTVPVSSGALVKRGERILIGAEQMFVESVIGNNLICERAQLGSVLAEHVSTDVVYVPRLCTITRGAAGTTATNHADASTLVKNRAPGSVAEAATASAINYLEQGKAAYGRTAGAGDHRRSTGGTGVAAAIVAAMNAAYDGYGRKGRSGAV